MFFLHSQKLPFPFGLPSPQGGVDVSKNAMFTGCSLPPATCLQVPCVSSSMPQVFNGFWLSPWFFAPCHRSALPSPCRAYDLRRRLAACVVVSVNVPFDGFRCGHMPLRRGGGVRKHSAARCFLSTVNGIVHPCRALVNTFLQIFLIFFQRIVSRFKPL